jgi:AcrR family transcriptional regulator
MPRPSQKPTILAAALDCFSEQGYAATRIHQIAERAGVTEGALYRHYPSKEAIARDLFITSFASFAGHMLEIARAGQRPDEQIRQVVRTSLAAYREQPAAFRFVLLRERPFGGPMPPDTVYPLDVVEGIIRAGQQAGQVRDGQPNVLAAMVFGCILWPIIVSLTADPGALDLLGSTAQDELIVAAAWAAIAAPAHSD